MPYFTDYGALKKDDEEDQPQISGAAPTTEKDGTGADPSGAAGTHAKSGFTNIDKYLGANDSSAFGQQFVGKVQGEVDQARGAQDTAADKFKQTSQSLNQVPTSEQVNSAIANPTSADPTQFQKWMTDTYAGPHSLAETQDLYNQYWGGTQKAKTSADLLGSEGGRFSLLDSYFGRPNYNFGEKSLDNLLVQHSGAQNQQRGLQNQAVQLQSAGNQEEKNLQNFASQRASEVDASRKNARAAIGVDDTGQIIKGANAGAIGKEIGSVDDQVALKNEERHKLYSDAQLALKSGKLTPEQMTQFGLQPGMDIFDLDLSDPKYLQKGADLTQNNVLSDDQRAKIRALESLGGVTDTYAAGSTQAADNPFTVLGGQISKAAASRGGEYLNEFQSTPLAIPGLGFKAGDGSLQAWRDYRDKLSGPNSMYNPETSAYYVNAINAALAPVEQSIKQKYHVGNKVSFAGNPSPGGMIGNGSGSRI